MKGPVNTNPSEEFETENQIDKEVLQDANDQFVSAMKGRIIFRDEPLWITNDNKAYFNLK